MSLRRFGAATLAAALLTSLIAATASAQAALPFRAYGSGLNAGQAVEAFNGSKSVAKTSAGPDGTWVLDILPETAQAGDVITFTRDGQPTSASIVFSSGQFTPPPGLTLSVTGSASAPTPATSANPSTYTIQAGDTLSALAVKWNTTSDAIAQLNGVTDPTLLQIGQVLKVPGGSASGSASASSGGTSAGTYTIVAGDTLYALAAKWGTTSDAIAQLNGITNPAGLQIGQVLKVPGASTSTPAGSSASGGSGTYTVVTGDNLSSLAVAWGTTVDKIASLNGISDPGSLQIGQILKKP